MTHNKSRAQQSGDLAEQFVHRTFGIREDDEFEVKAVARHPGNAIVRFFQLSRTAHKTYVFVRYDRRWYWHEFTSGPRAGKQKRTPELSMVDAYKKEPVHVIFMTGTQVLRLLATEKRPIQSVTHKRTQTTRYYFRIHWSALMRACIEHETRKTWVVYRHRDLHPDAIHPSLIQTSLPVPGAVEGSEEFFDDDIPF